MRGFGSDNHATVHPELLAAINDANLNHAPSYGTDDWTDSANKKIRSIFGTEWHPFFVFNGTAANVLSLGSHLESFHSVACADVSHLNVDECGAPEKIAGVKLIPLKSHLGKVSVDTIEEVRIRLGDQHFSQLKMVSITQPTELGTVYSLEEIKAIASYCQKHELLLHLDGTRFFNACISLDCEAPDIARYFDVISLGGTKNGFMMGEAVLVKNPERAKVFKFFRKQYLQLPSKTRFISCQFARYFTNELYLKIAAHSCSMAKQLEQRVREVPFMDILYPVESNAVFARFPKKFLKKMREKYFFYVWDENDFSVRLMTSWDTTEEDIEGFYNQAMELTRETSL